MGFFLVLECFVLICYVTTIFVVESRAYSTRGRKKSNLWRVILPACCVGCLGILLFYYFKIYIFLFFIKINYDKLSFNIMFIIITLKEKLYNLFDYLSIILAKVLRLGILANPETRHKAGQVVLLLLFNTHLCCCTIGFITLLFFWYTLILFLSKHI